MTQADLKEIEGRLNAATYGPWNRSTYGNQVLTGDSEQMICWLRREFNENQINDADFIAHAHKDVWSLLREVRRLQRDLDRCTADCQRLNAQVEPLIGQRDRAVAAAQGIIDDLFWELTERMTALIDRYPDVIRRPF